MFGSRRSARRQRGYFEGLRHFQGSEIMSRVIAFVLVFCATLNLSAAVKSSPADIEGSIVQLEVTRKQYDFVQPWTRRVDQVQKVGTVVGAKEILTTAEFLNDLTLLRVQRGGRVKWFPAELQWIDYHANLAIVTCKDEVFWKGLKPA